MKTKEYRIKYIEEVINDICGREKLYISWFFKNPKHTIIELRFRKNENELYGEKINLNYNGSCFNNYFLRKINKLLISKNNLLEW